MNDAHAKIYPAHVAGILAIVVAAGVFFIAPVAAAALLFAYVVLCVAACFFPGTDFLGPVINRGRTKENKVALTFDDGPCVHTTLKILDLLDRHQARAMFFVSGDNARRHPELISEIVRRGHEIGNHSMRHDPLVMLKSAKILEREVSEAQMVLHKMGIEALAFRPPVGIINPKLPAILRRRGLYCVTFSLRARDAGNRRVKNLAGRILKKVTGDDIILLHDTPVRRGEDEAVFWGELEKIFAGLKRAGLMAVSLSELTGRQMMRFNKPQ